MIQKNNPPVERHDSVLSVLAIVLIVIGMMPIALATLRDIAAYITQYRVKQAPAVQSEPLPDMYNIDRYLNLNRSESSDVQDEKKGGEK